MIMCHLNIYSMSKGHPLPSGISKLYQMDMSKHVEVPVIKLDIKVLLLDVLLYYKLIITLTSPSIYMYLGHKKWTTSSNYFNHILTLPLAIIISGSLMVDFTLTLAFSVL